MGTAGHIERISIRTDSGTKNLLERAAESMHVTVSSYLFDAAQVLYDEMPEKICSSCSHYRCIERRSCLLAEAAEVCFAHSARCI